MRTIQSKLQATDFGAGKGRVLGKPGPGKISFRSKPGGP